VLKNLGGRTGAADTGQDTSFLMFLLHWLFPEYEQRTLYGALVVTLAMLLRLINRRFIIIIIINNTGFLEHPADRNYTKLVNIKL